MSRESAALAYQRVVENIDELMPELLIKRTRKFDRDWDAYDYDQRLITTWIVSEKHSVYRDKYGVDRTKSGLSLRIELQRRSVDEAHADLRMTVVSLERDGWTDAGRGMIICVNPSMATSRLVVVAGATSFFKLGSL